MASCHLDEQTAQHRPEPVNLEYSSPTQNFLPFRNLKVRLSFLLEDRGARVVNALQLSLILTETLFIEIQYPMISRLRPLVMAAETIPRSQYVLFSGPRGVLGRVPKSVLALSDLLSVISLNYREGAVGLYQLSFLSPMRPTRISRTPSPYFLCARMERRLSISTFRRNFL
jgi:hypothetical protein